MVKVYKDNVDLEGSYPGTKLWVTIRKGERIVAEGTVISRGNYGSPGNPDWYVEFHQDGHPRKYRYAKQQYDKIDEVSFSDVKWEV